MFYRYIVDSVGVTLTLKLPGGLVEAGAACVATVVQPQTGTVISTQTVGAGGGVKVPATAVDDVALTIRC